MKEGDSIKAFHHKYSLSWPWSLLAAVALSGIITLLCLWCQPNALRVVLQHLKAQPILIILNAAPIGLLILCFGFLSGNIFTSAAIVNLCAGLLSIANRIKLEVRDEPVFPRDFALLREVGSAVQQYRITYPISAIALVLLLSFLLFILGYVIRTHGISFPKISSWIPRFLGSLLSLGVLVGAIFTVYASNNLYNSFRVSNAYYIPSVFNEIGFPYCFFHQFTTFSVERPDGFSRNEAESWDHAETVSQGTPVHVIMVMDEAFSDLADSPAFAYTEETTPLKNLHALQNSSHAITGHIVVPGYAAGTANTEFDVLTGMQTNALSPTTTSALRTVNRNLDSLFRVFREEGYRTSFFHPGDDWFYNRENVFHWFGAETTRFIDEMESPISKGRWVTDEYCGSLIQDEFEQALQDDHMLFHYTTTIQNHMSYTLDKYGPDHTFADIPSTKTLSENSRAMLSVYMEGVQDADQLLGSLVSYFEEQNAPVVLVFFGDHMPSLGSCYDELELSGDAEWNDLLSYETPFVIWANNSAADVLSFEERSASLELPEDSTISAAFLGASLLELTGRREASSWFSFLNQLRRDTPIVQKQLLITSDEASAQAMISQWRKWSYYKLRYKRIP